MDSTGNSVHGFYAKIYARLGQVVCSKIRTLYKKDRVVTRTEKMGVALVSFLFFCGLFYALYTLMKAPVAPPPMEDPEVFGEGAGGDDFDALPDTRPVESISREAVVTDPETTKQ